MKTVTSILMAVSLALLALPVFAQQDSVNVQFRLTVTGGPCPNATYFAVFGVPQGEFFSEQLTDPEGDGVYTLSRALGAGNPLYISIQQGIGTVQEPPSPYLLPGPPRSTIRDFGLITPTEGMVFEASVQGCPAPPDGGTTPGDSQVSLQFRLTVQGAPCPDATYWGLIGVPQSEGFGVQLTDPDGDRVYTGSTSWGVGNPLFIRLVQGTGTQQVPPVPGPLPGEPSVTIKDFGLVPITGDMVFEGSVAGCPAGLPDTGESDTLPVVPIAGGILVLAAGIYLRRRLLQHGSY